MDTNQLGKIPAKYGNKQLWSPLSEVCQMLGIKPPASLQNSPEENEYFRHIQYKPGQFIQTEGQPFEMLYIVYSGFLKTFMTTDDVGSQQVLSFPMKSDIFGVDGIYSKFHTCNVVALSNCDIILVPFKRLTALSKKYPSLEQAIYGVMSRELVKEQSIIRVLSTLSAKERIARFLLLLSERFAQLGYSSKTFNLRMTRLEIGSYIGLTLETVSRTMSNLEEMGLIAVDKRTIEIKDLQALKNLKEKKRAHRHPTKKYDLVAAAQSIAEKQSEQ